MYKLKIVDFEGAERIYRVRAEPIIRGFAGHYFVFFSVAEGCLKMVRLADVAVLSYSPVSVCS